MPAWSKFTFGFLWFQMIQHGLLKTVYCCRLEKKFIVWDVLGILWVLFGSEEPKILTILAWLKFKGLCWKCQFTGADWKKTAEFEIFQEFCQYKFGSEEPKNRPYRHGQNFKISVGNVFGHFLASCEAEWAYVMTISVGLSGRPHSINVKDLASSFNIYVLSCFMDSKSPKWINYKWQPCIVFLNNFFTEMFSEFEKKCWSLFNNVEHCALGTL